MESGVVAEVLETTTVVPSTVLTNEIATELIAKVQPYHLTSRQTESFVQILLKQVSIAHTLAVFESNSSSTSTLTPIPTLTFTSTSTSNMPPLGFVDLPQSAPFQKLEYYKLQKPSKVIHLKEPGCYVRIYEPLFPPSTIKKLLQHWTSKKVIWDLTQYPQFGVNYIQPRTHSYQVKLATLLANIPLRLRGGAGDYGYVYRPRGRRPRGPRGARAGNREAQVVNLLTTTTTTLIALLVALLVA